MENSLILLIIFKLKKKNKNKKKCKKLIDFWIIEIMQYAVFIFFLIQSALTTFYKTKA